METLFLFGWVLGMGGIIYAARYYLPRVLAEMRGDHHPRAPKELLKIRIGFAVFGIGFLLMFLSGIIAGMNGGWV